MPKTQASIDYAGSVSSGTLRADDLIPAFLTELCEHWLEKAQEFERELDHHDNELRTGACDQEYYDEQRDFILDDLFDALNEVAPPGHYFGAHPGDGADFGFWPVEDE